MDMDRDRYASAKHQCVRLDAQEIGAFPKPYVAYIAGSEVATQQPLLATEAFSFALRER